MAFKKLLVVLFKTWIFLSKTFASFAKSSETDTVILQLIKQTFCRLKFTLSGHGFFNLRQSVSEFFHQVARCVNGITSVIWEDAEIASTRF